MSTIKFILNKLSELIEFMPQARGRKIFLKYKFKIIIVYKDTIHALLNKYTVLFIYHFLQSIIYDFNKL